MAGYSFETMTDSDAAAFGTGDYLFFITKGATANQVSVAPYSNGSSGSLSNSGITLTYGGKSLTFGTAISTASTSGHIVFNDSSHLVVGTQGAETGATAITLQGSTNAAGAFVDPNTVYALGGNDTITGTNAAAGVSNYLNGGFGADTINGGDANNHIYGNSMTSKAGDVDTSGVRDGADSITAGSGSNYINGNAGADIITVGTANTAANGAASNASTGFNRVFGGADNDTITVRGAGLATVNGNTGNDTITAATATGDNTLRGGQGDDTITGGAGHDILMGDAGKDVLHVSGTVGHITLLTGGADSDTFDFSTARAGQAANFGQVTYFQEITDFTHSVDTIHLSAANTPMADGDIGTAATVFANVHDAAQYAASQLQVNGGTHLVESLSVGTANNTYLFYSETANTDPSNAVDQPLAGLGVIHLDNFGASTLTQTDFS